MAAEGWIWRWGWGRRCPGRPGLPGPGPGPTTLLFVLLLGAVAADITDGNSEHLKREHSLIKPYQGVGSSSMPLWDFQGSTMLTSQYVRLTPDERSKEGSIWNHQPCFLKDWEMHVHFKVHGTGKKNLHGDGIALWYTRDRLVPGPVFGSKDNFHGLAIFLDTYPNDETTERVFPYISVMVNNGSLSYDHSKDGRWTELAGCTADFRNRDHDTFLAVRYSRGRLTVMTDLEDKNEWKNCIDITGVRLPTGYYFGASAGTGDLSDNHDIISMKLFQLMVEHTPDEENIDWTKIEPSVNFLKSPKGLAEVHKLPLLVTNPWQHHPSHLFPCQQAGDSSPHPGRATRHVTERKRKGREREDFHPPLLLWICSFSFHHTPSTGSLSKWPHRPGWARLKPGARNQEIPLGLPRGYRGPSTGTIFHCFPRPLTGSWIGSGAAGTRTSGPFRMPALQTEALPTTPQHQPLLAYF
uniref:Lectin, mannose binding 2 n=2 Tax=Oryctolagus cuniculus TaxID=9986 RepID=A0A5F9DGC4_RABIT